MGKRTAIIFDIGGTLYKPAHDVCRHFLTEIGLSIHNDLTDQQIAEIMKNSGGRWLDNYMIENKVHQYWKPSQSHWIQYDRVFLSALGVRENLNQLARRYQSKWDNLLSGLKRELVEGCQEVLEALYSQGYKLGIASNRFDDPRPMLKEDGILHFFNAIDYTNVPGLRKPSPFLLLNVAKMLGVPREKCYYVGNSLENDVVAARQAGMQPILATWCRPEIESEQVPDYVIIVAQFKELLDVLNVSKQSGII